MRSYSYDQQPPPHFFKVVMRPLDEGFEIPPLFMRRYGDSLEKRLVFKVPDGAEWQVEWQRNCINGGTWLQGKGLREFGDFYSLKEHHFLVFRYEGNSRFSVVIMDATASEIDYPVGPTRQRKDEEVNIMKNEDEDNSDSIETSERIQSKSKRGRKRVNVDNIEKIGEQNLGLSYTVVRGRRLRRRINDGSCEGTSMAPPPPSSSMPRSNLSKNEKLRACERDFRSKHPYFACFVQPTQVSEPYGVNIPAFFARNKFAKNRRMDYKIHLSGEKKAWPVRVWTRGRYGRIGGDGWRRFAEAKGLRVGEVCIFELVQKNKVFNLYRNC